MPKSPKQPRVPSYRRHKPSGQAIVTLDGRDFYLGPWRSKRSKTEYDRLIGEWLAGGRQLAVPKSADGITITELIARYWNHAESYYRKHGRATKELAGIRESMRPLKRLYGRTRANDFGPLALRAVRQDLINDNLCISTINCRIGRIKRMYRWATSFELVQPEAFHALQALEGLRKGRADAPDPKTIKPVHDRVVDATLRHVPPIVASMIRLQRLTGMRSGELVIMRGCDLDTSGKVWEYRPEHHKTEHHGHGKTICLGPRAQEIIRPMFKADLSAYLFSAAEAETQRRAELHRRRKTPLSCGNRPGTNRKRRPKRSPRDHYDTDSYRRAITRGCAKAFPAPDGLTDEQLKAWKREHHWHPHQLRHSAATRLRREYGLEAARVVLGHRSAAITELYAEVDQAKAAEIMAKVG